MRLIGMLCWTERGTFTFTRSLLFAAARVLIKVSTPLSVEAVIAEVFSDVLAIPGKQELGLDDRPKELLKGHAVVTKKARHGSGRGEDDAEPACGFLADHITQEQICACGNAHGKDCAEELTGGQTEENALLVLSDLFRDFNFFDGFYLQFVRKFDRYLLLRDNISRKMFRKELDKMNTTQQVLIVLAGLALLPLVIRLLWMAHLLPAALYLFATRLCFPGWAAANSSLCAGLFAGAVLYFLFRWSWKIGKHLHERKRRIADFVNNARPFYELPEFQRWAEQ